MAIIESATRDALLVLRILKLIPRNHWISTPEIKQALEESGYAIEPRRLQRILRDIHRCDDLYVECNTAGKPYGYRAYPRYGFGLGQTATPRRVCCSAWQKNT